MNLLDTFIERGNNASLPIIGRDFTWQGSTYTGTVGAIEQELFFGEEGRGKKPEIESRLEVALSQFPAGTRPQIEDTVVIEGTTYRVVRVESLDTTTVAYRIRVPLSQA